MTGSALSTRLGVVLATALTLGLLGGTPALADDSAASASSVSAGTTPAPTAAADNGITDGGEEKTPETPEPLPALSSSVPAVTGTALVGSTLTAKPGAWTPGATLAYRWYADGAAIGGATKPTLTITTAQLGKALTVRVTGTKPGYTTVVTTSKATTRVPRTAPATISGTRAIGATLTAKPGTWSKGTAFSYQWYANGRAIKNAKASKLALASSLAGTKIAVKVTGRKSGYTTASKTSGATPKIIRAGAAKIAGTAVQGKKLTAKTGTWTAGTRLSYRWYANGTAIKGATRAAFTVTSAQLGKAITVKITGKKAGYATVVKTSKATKKVPRTATPTISGAKKLGSTLAAKPGTWSKGTSFSYRWYANGKVIKNATGSRLALTKSRLGKKITVRVTGKKAGYSTVSKTSKPTAKITYPSRTTPSSSWSCPSWAPIKGNASSMIYHVPGGAYYDRTKPEECFSTRAAAERAGYRASKR